MVTSHPVLARTDEDRQANWMGQSQLSPPHAIHSSTIDLNSNSSVWMSSTRRNLSAWILFLFVLLSASQVRGEEQDREDAPFDFNAVLDSPPGIPSKERVVEWTQGAGGFRVGMFGGLSFGSAASYLSPRISSLDRGMFPFVGLSFSYRLGAGRTQGLLRRFELDLSSALGFGRTFEKGDYDDALDIHIRPGVTFHAFEGQQWATSLMMQFNAIVFDSEGGEVSQLAVGPAIGPRLTWKMSDLSQIYLSFSWSTVYDFMAFSFRDPTEEELEDDPTIKEIKVKGDWFNHYQVSLGFRLLGF